MANHHTDKKANSIKNLIQKITAEEIDLPDEALVFLDLYTLLQVVTEKRVEIIEIIAKHSPHSIQKIADQTNRKKQAVDRDIKILEKYGIIELLPEGREKIPKLMKKIVVFNLAEPEESGQIKNDLIMSTHKMGIVS